MSGTTDNQVIDDIATTTKPSWNPLRCTGTGLPTNITVLVKALALVILMTHNFRRLPEPWLPFIPWISNIPPLLFQRTLEGAFILSIFAILSNQQVRLGALILGATILTATASSKTYYGNNRIYCGLILFFAGCYKEGGPPFIRWQLALTYFGAGLNKLFDHDWHTGVFFDYWAAQRLHEPIYMWIRSYVPPLQAGKFFSWYTIFSELGVVPFLLSPNIAWFYWGALANIIFQCSLLLFVGNTFTLFWYGMCGTSLAFMTWPTHTMTVLHSSRFPRLLMRVLKFVDVDHRFAWKTSMGSLKLITNQKSYTGARALRMIVLYNPLTYIAIGAIMALGGGNGISSIIFRRVYVSLLLVILMPPLAWCIDKLFGRSSSEEPAI